MGRQYYYMRFGKQVGPVPSAEIRRLASSGQLSPTDLVWTDSMPSWVPAEKIKGLFAAQTSIAPAAAATPPKPPTAVQVRMAPAANGSTAALIAPERGISIVDRRLTASPHLMALAVATALLVLLSLIWLIGIASGRIVVPWMSFAGAIGIVILIVRCFSQFTSAKAHAIQHRGQDWRDAKIFFGLARLVLWEANEGLLLLKNKRVCDVIYGQTRGGGTAIIYPVLGEEVRIKIPLTFLPCEFKDVRVLSGDGIHLQVRLTFWWRILDERGLETFYLVVDREIHKADDEDRERVLNPDARDHDGLSQGVSRRELGSEYHAAEIWIRKIVESCTRNLVSRTTANRALAQLTGTSPDSSSPLHPEAPDLLSADLRNMVQNEIENYGFYVDRIAIQDVQLPFDLQNEIHKLHQAKFIPARSQLEAEQRYFEIKRSLEASASVIGADATAVKQILESVRTSCFFGGIPPQLEALVAPLVGRIAGALAHSGQHQSLAMQSQTSQPLTQPPPGKN